MQPSQTLDVVLGPIIIIIIPIIITLVRSLAPNATFSCLTCFLTASVYLWGGERAHVVAFGIIVKPENSRAQAEAQTKKKDRQGES